MNDKVKAVAGPIVLATDASVGPDRVASGYLATTGHTGLRAHLYPKHLVRPRSRVVVTELRAVYWGLKAVLHTHPGRPIEIRVDNLQALRHLHSWQQGGTDIPEGYDTHLRSQGRQPSLVKLQLIAEYTPHLTFVHEKAHAGHPLNEAADSWPSLACGACAAPSRAPNSRVWSRCGLQAPSPPGPPDAHSSFTSHAHPQGASTSPGGTMSQQQYPQQPQPGWGGPQQPGYGTPPFQPQPPKKSKAGKIVGFGCLGVVALFVLIGIAAAAGGGNGDSTDTGAKDKAVAAGRTPESDKAEATPAQKTKTQAEQFKACVAKSGTATEKKAVQHVTKVTGADKRNDILDAAEVYTDFSGGLMSDSQGDAKLIASAFTSCYESKNGLVSVYGQDGDLVANANY